MSRPERVIRLPDALLAATVDWPAWYDRWEAMMGAYTPHRGERFARLADATDWAKLQPLRLLDLGAGPGSLAVRLLKRFPGARALAVEGDPVLVAIGLGMAGARGLHQRLDFHWADLRSGDGWAEPDVEDNLEQFDGVVSASALHWLSREHLAEVYQRAHRVLRPGGWLLHADHMAAADRALQARWRALLADQQAAQFAATGADRWGEFWQSMGEALAAVIAPGELDGLRGVDTLWQGSDDGQPLNVHLELLRAAGFEIVEVVWRDLGEAVVAGKKIG